MGLSIRPAHDAPFGQPRPMLLVLICDNAHGCRHRGIYDHAAYDTQLQAARVDGWRIRVGDYAKTLCRDCCRQGRGGAGQLQQGELF